MNEETLFQEALSRPPGERPAFLDRACEGRADLREAVETLLASREGPGETLDGPPIAPTPTEATGPTRPPEPPTVDRASTGPGVSFGPAGPIGEDRATSGAGTVIAGRYALREKIGEGGMGEVWVADQTEPVRRKVALKLIKTGMDSRGVLLRFERERQALAMMEHPNIARVLDGGMTPTGRPFFVMELVDGLPLTRFCDEAKLTPRDRLELFVPICQAVQHAHQKGIVHRDLKPANILVARIDGKPVPKVIDFGVAKATAGDLTDGSMSTQFGAVVGTLEYMSPEQAGFSDEDIDTRADVYSLGVVLYELLTGLRPIDAKRLKKAAMIEMIRMIREDEPSKPSTRLSADESLPSMAALRRVEPRKLMALLRGDLDWVVMKCLEKRRERRYETANALARDVQRYLADEAVEARPPSAAYRLGKLIRRNKGSALAASLVFLALIGGIAGTTFGLIRAEDARASEARRAEGERRARLEAVAAKEEAVAAREVAVAAEKAGAEQRARADQNAQLAGMQATLALNTIQDMIAQVQTKLSAPGLFEVKAALLDAALKRIDGVAGVYDRSTSKEATVLAALMELARIYREVGQSEKAFRLYERCLVIAKERVKIKQGSDPSRQNLANVYRDLALISEEFRRDMKASLAYNEESLRIWVDVSENPKPDQWRLDEKVVHYFLAEAQTRVGVGHYRLGDILGARGNFREAFRIRQGLVARSPDDPRPKQDLSYSSMALAETSFRLGDKALADDYYRRALDQRREMFEAKPDVPAVREQLAAVNYMIGELKLKTGDLPAARAHLERSRGLRADLVGADPRNAIARRDLGITLYRLGNLADLEEDDEAAAEAFEAARRLQQGLVDDDEHNDKRQLELMTTLAHLGQVEKAAGIADRLGAGPDVDNEARLDLARCYAQCARHAPRDRLERSRDYPADSVGAIRKAIDAGFKDLSCVELEPDLEPLRPRGDFQALLARLGPAR